LKISIIIPTYNASHYLQKLLTSLCSQTLQDPEIIIIDSSSEDRTIEIAENFKVRVFSIPKEQFDHGGTRTKAGKMATGDILVYLTQDALPANDEAVTRLITPFCKDEMVGLTFGRQLPHDDATPYAMHRRLFNYPDHSYTREIVDKHLYGIKAAFCSNSFAAYRRTALEDVGWFKENLVMGEDLHVAARMLIKGYRLSYVADASVYHSHNYTAMQEFNRYFDLGVFFERERWLLTEFGQPESEGIRSVKSEVTFLISSGLVHLIPISLIRAGARLVGYRLGLLNKMLPPSIVSRLSMYSA
jgi:rhamnosyltransferase